MGNCSSAPRFKALNLRAFIAANPSAEGYGDEWYFDTMNVLLDRWAYSHVQFLRKKFLEATGDKGEKEVDKKGFFKLFGQLQDMPKAVAESAFRMFDTDNSGKLNFREFCCALALCCHLMSSDDEKIRFVFDMFDTNDDGLLNASDVQLLLENAIRDDDGKDDRMVHRQLRINEMKQELLGNVQYLTFERFHEWATRHLDSLNSLLHTFQIVPSPERERAICEEILGRHQALQEGSTWYCVSHKWLQVWKAHACWRGPSPGRRITASHALLTPVTLRERGLERGISGCESDFFDDDDGLEEPLGVLSECGVNHMSARPPEIDNSDLEGEHKGELKMNLVEHLDYELIPEEMWLRLVEWYGGGPAIPRKVICMGQDHQPQVELYPPLVLVVVAGENGQPLPQFSRRFFISRQSSLEEVLQMLAEKLSRPGERSRLWHRATGDRWRLVQQMTLPLEEFLEGKVRDAGAFLLETQRPSGEWPRDDILAASPGDGSADAEKDLQRHFEVGDRVEAQSGVTSQWMRGTIVDVIQRDHSSAPSQVKVHYDSTVYKCDEWISTSSDRFAPLETFTSGTSSSSAAPATKGEQAGGGGAGGAAGGGDRPPPIRGATGLQNLGNTCFLNATIQCMANTPLFREYFLSSQYTKDINERGAGCKGRLAEEFGHVMLDLWGGKSTALTPRNLKRTIDQFAPQFAGYEQHDAQELLAFFLDGLHEDLNRSLPGSGAGTRSGNVGNRRDSGTPKLFSSSRREFVRAGVHQVTRSGSRDLSPKRSKAPSSVPSSGTSAGIVTPRSSLVVETSHPLQEGVAFDDGAGRSSEAVVDPSQLDEPIEQIGLGTELTMPDDEAQRVQQRVIHPTMLWSRPRPEEAPFTPPSGDRGVKPSPAQTMHSKVAWIKQAGEASSPEDAPLSAEEKLPSNPKVSQPGLAFQDCVASNPSLQQCPLQAIGSEVGGEDSTSNQTMSVGRPALSGPGEMDPLLEQGIQADSVEQESTLSGALEHRALGFRQPPPASAIAAADFDVAPQLTSLVPPASQALAADEGSSGSGAPSSILNAESAAVVQPPPSIGGGGGGGVSGMLSGPAEDSDEARRPATAASVWSTAAASSEIGAAQKSAPLGFSGITTAGAAVAAVFGVNASGGPALSVAPAPAMNGVSGPPLPSSAPQSAAGEQRRAEGGVRRGDLDKKGPGTSRWWSFAWRRGRGALDLPKEAHSECPAVLEPDRALNKVPSVSAPPAAPIVADEVVSANGSVATSNAPSTAGPGGATVPLEGVGSGPGRETMALLEELRPKLPAGAAAAAVASVSASRAASEVGEDGSSVPYTLNQSEDFVPELLTPQRPGYRRSLSLFSLSWRRRKREEGDMLNTPKRRPRTPPAMMPLREEVSGSLGSDGMPCAALPGGCDAAADEVSAFSQSGPHQGLGQLALGQASSSQDTGADTTGPHDLRLGASTSNGEGRPLPDEVSGATAAANTSVAAADSRNGPRSVSHASTTANQGGERARSRDGGRVGRTKDKESSWPSLWRRSKSRDSSSSRRQRPTGLRPPPAPPRGDAAMPSDAAAPTGGSSAVGAAGAAATAHVAGLGGTLGSAGSSDTGTAPAAAGSPEGDGAVPASADASVAPSNTQGSSTGGSGASATLGFPFLRAVPWKRGGDPSRGNSPLKPPRPDSSGSRAAEEGSHDPADSSDDGLGCGGREATPPTAASSCSPQRVARAGPSGAGGYGVPDPTNSGQEETEQSEEVEDDKDTEELDEDNLPDDEKAARQWERYRSQNRSLIVDIFEGQLRSQLTCSECGASSSTFEPFRYLSVPIPSNHVDRASLRIVFFGLPFSRGDERPQLTRYCVAVPKSSTVQKVEKALSRVLPVPMTSVLLAEVYRSRIHRYLDSSLSLNDVRSEDQLFAFEVLQTPDELTQYQERHASSSRHGPRREKQPDADPRKSMQTRVLLIQAMHRRVVDVCRSDGRTWAQRREVFGLPFVMSAASSWSYATLHDMLMFHARRFLKTPRRDALRYDHSSTDDRPGAQAQLPFVARIVNASGTACGACDRRNCTGCLLPKGNARLRLRAGLLTGTVSTAKIYLALDWVDSTAYDQEYVDTVADDASVAQPATADRPTHEVEEADGDRSPTPSADGTGAPQREMSRTLSQAPGTVPISACIDAFAEPEELKTELGNGVKCEKCNKVVDAVKRLEIWREPDVLLIHIKRFRFSGVHYEKLNTPVEVPCRELSLRPWIVGPSGASSAPYELYAAACHWGGMSGGHYTSFAVNNEGKEPQWLKFNDESVSSVSMNQELDEVSKQCYVLFYRKRAFSSSNLINYSHLV